jgi:hypothetical protein
MLSPILKIKMLLMLFSFHDFDNLENTWQLYVHLNAIRPHEKVAHLVASDSGYDVVNKEETAEVSKRKSVKLLCVVTRSEIELNNDVDHYSKEVYKKQSQLCKD